MSDTGHNSADTLKSIVDRIYNLEIDKRTASEDIRDLKAEAKDAGLSATAIMRIVKEKLRDADKAAREKEIAEMVDAYKVQLKLI